MPLAVLDYGFSCRTPITGLRSHTRDPLSAAKYPFSQRLPIALSLLAQAVRADKGEVFGHAFVAHGLAVRCRKDEQQSGICARDLTPPVEYDAISAFIDCNSDLRFIPSDLFRLADFERRIGSMDRVGR